MQNKISAIHPLKKSGTNSALNTTRGATRITAKKQSLTAKTVVGYNVPSTAPLISVKLLGLQLQSVLRGMRMAAFTLSATH